MKLRINKDHYLKVLDARKQQGLNTSHCFPVESELIGKKIINVSTGEEYKIESAHRLWQQGWYEVLMVVNDIGSHSMAIWQLFNCKNDTIVDFYNRRNDYWLLTNE